MTDFGAEESFARAAVRVAEHYGIKLASSALRRITYRHARKIAAVQPVAPSCFGSLS